MHGETVKFNVTRFNFVYGWTDDGLMTETSNQLGK
jgi:hypothetical protein